MRVLKENNTEKKHKCSHCKSIYAYTGKDIGIYDFIRCPVCSNLDEISIFDRRVKEK